MNKQNEQEKSYDVIIVGGGISGAIAAIAAGRLGASVLLIEQHGFLGGMLTASGVGPMMSFYAGETQVVKGIADELIERLASQALSPGHIDDTTGFVSKVTPFDLEGMKLELDRMTTEAGVDVLFHTQLANAETHEGRVTEITVCNKAGLTKLSATVYVDASGDADLAARSGVRFVKGREKDGLMQPMTMKIRVRNVDVDRIVDYVNGLSDEEFKAEFPGYRYDRSRLAGRKRLSLGGFAKTLQEARRDGIITFEREALLFFETNNLGEVIVNTSRITGLDATDPWQLSKAEALGRKQAWEIVRFLRERIPGFENAVVAFTGPNIGVRSSRQIEGSYSLTRDDVAQGRLFDDAVACYGYPIDIHSPTGNGTHHGFMDKGSFYSIPYRCLTNSVVRNLIVVGRSISSTFEAQSSYRTTPGAAAIGHAGGVSAYVASRSDGDFLQVPVAEIQRLLKQQGAFLPI